jgi:hypothetical protein
MDASVEPHCSGVKPEKGKFLDQKYWRMQRNKFKWFVKVWRWINLDRRAMQTKEEETYERYPQIQGQGEVSPKICQTIQDYWPQGRSGLLAELPPQLSEVHDVFHVSQLKKCLRVPEEQLPMEYLDLGGDLTYSERPIKILHIVEQVTCSKIIKMCKVQWSHHTEDEAMWEHEEELRADYPKLFPNAS